MIRKDLLKRNHIFTKGGVLMNSYDAVVTGVLIVYYIIILALAVLTLSGSWKVFTKAGKPGWACLIPFYSQYCQFDIAWGNGWMFLLTLIPCVNIVVMVMYSIKLAKAFGQGTGFGIGLFFLTPIFIPILGFGSAQYIGPQD